VPANPYIPDRGDIVYLSFDSSMGREQRSHRSAFVISPISYNQKSSLALLMPITSQQKGYSFEVLLPPGLQIRGVILVDQIRALDWRARNVQFTEKAPVSVIEEVQGKIEALLL
jgi:mRNA interferase MazF